MADCSLCITNEKLYAVVGSANKRRVTVKNFAETTLTEGTLINGVITDERLLALALDALREKLPDNSLRDVHIALRSSQILTKRMAVPALSEKKMLEWITGAFSDAAGSDEMFYDYMVLARDKETGGQVALLAAAQQSMVEGLSKFFEAQKVTVASIDAMLSAQIKLVRLLKETRDSTFIFLNMDGAGMDASLYVSGSFRYGNSVRLLSERGTAESATEISRQVSSIIQFNTSERSGQTITNVYVTGLRANEERLYEALHSAYGLEAGPLTDGSGCIASPTATPLPLTGYAHAVGNLIEL